MRVHRTIACAVVTYTGYTAAWGTTRSARNLTLYRGCADATKPSAKFNIVRFSA